MKKVLSGVHQAGDADSGEILYQEPGSVTGTQWRQKRTE